jgi:hypothetical protein
MNEMAPQGTWRAGSGGVLIVKERKGLVKVARGYCSEFQQVRACSNKGAITVFRPGTAAEPWLRIFSMTLPENLPTFDLSEAVIIVWRLLPIFDLSEAVLYLNECCFDKKPNKRPRRGRILVAKSMCIMRGLGEVPYW